MKAPAFQFYPGDWMKDPQLRAVSSACRGLWIDMLCLMWESARKGFLVHPTGRAVSTEQLARMTGNSVDETARMLQELEDCGVCSRTGDGILYSRRLERDERIRQTRSECGKLGGNPNLLNQNTNQEVNHRVIQEVKLPVIHGVNQKVGSSSSASAEDPPPKEQVRGEPEPEPRTPPLQTVLSAAVTAGVPPDIAETFFHDCEKRPLSPSGHWTDRDGKQMRSWQSAMKAFAIRWQANQREREQANAKRSYPDSKPARTRNSGTANDHPSVHDSFS